MALDALQLPKDPETLARVVERHARRCAQQLMYRRTNWLLAWYYLNGYRRFDIWDPNTGNISPHLLDEEGNMEFQENELLYMINQVVGRIQSMDCRPKVDQQGSSLESLRNRALAQIMGDSVVPDDVVRRVQEEFGYLFACLGFCGLTGHLVDHPTIGLTSDIEVIHPRELFPFPITGQDFTKTYGIVRQRWVPVEHLRRTYGNAKVNARLDTMEWYSADHGDNWSDRDIVRGITYWSGSHPGQGDYGSNAAKDEWLEVAKVRELWLTGPAGTVTQYVCCSGEAMFQRSDLSGLEVYNPIGWARFFNNGTWHGAGMFDMLFSISRMHERLAKQLFNNVMDLDRYGILVLPQGQMPQNQILRDVGRGLRVMFWEPDAIAEGFKPFPIQPWNTGDMPGRVAQYAREGMRAINPIQDLIQEKGRIDSASGLQFLEEQITRAITSPTLGVVKAFGDMYRSLVQKVGASLMSSRRALPAGNLTLDLAGAIIDPKTNNVSFKENPLPSISRLSFTIRAVSPKSTVARKQEALDLWAKGVETDPMAFRLFAQKEGLDFAMWSDEDSGAYERAVRCILTTYGDGDTPGQVILTPHTIRPEIFMRVLNAFCTGPYMEQASAAVHNAIRGLRLTLINFMGLTLPNAVPNPDDAAMLSQPPMGTPLPMMGSGPQPSLPASR